MRKILDEQQESDTALVQTKTTEVFRLEGSSGTIYVVEKNHRFLPATLFPGFDLGQVY
jgi:hypothetical protein